MTTTKKTKKAPKPSGPEAALWKNEAKAQRAFKNLTRALLEARHEGFFQEVCALSDRFNQAVRDARATDEAVRSGAVEDATPTGFRWRRHDRRIIEGDVVRARSTVRDHPNYGTWNYAVCTGAGGGVDPDARGSAVFVRSASKDLSKTLAAAKTRLADASAEERWEATWGLEILEAVPEVPR